MKTLIIALLALTSLGAECWKIHDKDTRALCYSVNEHKKECWKIKDKDTRAYCEAKAYNQNACWKIKDRDKRAYCNAMKGK